MIHFLIDSSMTWPLATMISHSLRICFNLALLPNPAPPLHLTGISMQYYIIKYHPSLHISHNVT